MPLDLSLYTSYLYGYPIQQTLSCYGSKLEIRCPTSQIIHILSAYYGIQPTYNLNYCSQTQSLQTACFFEETYEYIDSLCEQKQTCSMTVNLNYFGDPCIGSSNKQLFVQFVCLDSSAYELVSSCPSSNATSICPPIGNDEAQFEQNWCQPSIANITCPENKVINITCAFYGVDKSKKSFRIV